MHGRCYYSLEKVTMMQAPQLYVLSALGESKTEGGAWTLCFTWSVSIRQLHAGRGDLMPPEAHRSLPQHHMICCSLLPPFDLHRSFSHHHWQQEPHVARCKRYPGWRTQQRSGISQWHCQPVPATPPAATPELPRSAGLRFAEIVKGRCAGFLSTVWAADHGW